MEVFRNIYRGGELRLYGLRFSPVNCFNFFLMYTSMYNIFTI